MSWPKHFVQEFLGIISNLPCSEPLLQNMILRYRSGSNRANVLSVWNKIWNIHYQPVKLFSIESRVKWIFSPLQHTGLMLCSTVLLTNLVVSVDISHFQSLISHKPSINRINFCYQYTDWGSFQNFLHDATWNDIFNHPVYKCATEVSS